MCSTDLNEQILSTLLFTKGNLGFFLSLQTSFTSSVQAGKTFYRDQDGRVWPSAAAYLPPLAVQLHLRQTGRLLGGSKRLELTEVGKVGLLRDLLGGGGAGERSSAPSCRSLSFPLWAVSGVRRRSLEETHRGCGHYGCSTYRFYLVNVMALMFWVSF